MSQVLLVNPEMKSVCCSASHEARFEHYGEHVSVYLATRKEVDQTSNTLSLLSSIGKKELECAV